MPERDYLASTKQDSNQRLKKNMQDMQKTRDIVSERWEENSTNNNKGHSRVSVYTVEI
jgi:hypothetical protein